jgi:hypothetical protein
MIFVTFKEISMKKMLALMLCAALTAQASFAFIQPSKADHSLILACGGGCPCKGKGGK